MVEMQQDLFFSGKETARREAFEKVWTHDLNEVFADLAEYYDSANHVASLGCLNWFRSRFISTVKLEPGQRVLDVCTGTHAVSIAMLQKCPEIEIHAIDRSAEMLQVGSQMARKNGLQIQSLLGDAHNLPFPDNHFDVVTLQYASRHLKVLQAFSEIRRVLKPGGKFYHCDMLRPDSRVVEKAYYLYLKACLKATACVFKSSQTALNSRKYFMEALEMFYSARELTKLLSELGFRSVQHESVFGGMVAFHKAEKPA
jgi:demethylmenaquinone methyltransferase/2-methoxy-6-polyprenyl-1,4-benzoquinol methylase